MRGRTVIVFGFVKFICGSVVKPVTICVVRSLTRNAVLGEAIVDCVDLALELMILRIQLCDSGSELRIDFS